MKFDKAMEIAYKILAVLTCAALVLGVVSCSKSYAIKASAVEISASEQAGIQDYIEAGQQGLINIDFRFDENSDGSRSTKLQIQGLQNLAFREQFNVYDNMDFSVAPDSISISGTSYSGVCYLDGVLHPASIYNCSGKSGVIASSDFFTISYGFDNPDDVVSAVTRSPGQLLVDHTSTVYIQMRSNFFSPNDIRFGGNAFDGINYSYSSRYIPSFSISSPDLLTENFVVCGEAQEITLPPGDYDSKKPWEYYNDTLLPYIRQNFNIQDIDQYLVFPDGYTPPQDSTEPPSITPGTPGGGVTIIAPVIVGVGGIFNIDGVDFDIFAPVKGQLSIDGIDFQFPRDDSSRVYINQTPYTIPLPEIEINGHTIALPDINTLIFDGAEFTINADGSMTINEQNYPLPIGQPETMESNAQYYIYKYEIPTLENINIPDAELEAPDLSQFANSLNFISSAAVDFVNDLGLMPFVIAMLSLGVFGYALWKIGG